MVANQVHLLRAPIKKPSLYNCGRVRADEEKLKRFGKCGNQTLRCSCEYQGTQYSMVSKVAPLLKFQVNSCKTGAAAAVLPCCSAASVLQRLSYGAVCRARWRLLGTGRYRGAQVDDGLVFLFFFLTAAGRMADFSDGMLLIDYVHN